MAFKYYEIKTYIDSECTTEYKPLKIILMPEPPDGGYGQRIITPYTTRSYYTSWRKNPPNFTNGLAYGCYLSSLFPFDARNSLSAFTSNDVVSRANTAWILSKCQDILPPGFSNTGASVDDGFNLYHMFKDDGSYYIKNGGSIKVEIDYENPEIRSDPRVWVYVYPTHNQTKDSQLWFRIYLNAYGRIDNGIRYANIGTFAENASLSQSNLDTKYYGCAYLSLCIVNPNSINTYDGITKCIAVGSKSFSGDIRTYWGFQGISYSYTPGDTYTTTCLTGTASGNLYRLLGKKSSFSETTIEYEEKEWTPPKEDDNNTYPGGGDDKNTYPDSDPDNPNPSGKGDFDNTNEPIDFPPLPTFDVTSTGFVSVWNPTPLQLTEFYAWLYDANNSNIIENIGSIFTKMGIDIYSAIYSLGIIPVDPQNVSNRSVTLARVPTGFNWKHVDKQFTDFDFGSVDINEYYGAIWDYSPYTKCSVYVPYVGVCEVDVDDVMNCKLTLRARIDIITGNFIAMLKSTRKAGRDNLNSVLYHFTGNCITKVPITVNDYSQFQSSMFNLISGQALTMGSAAGFSLASKAAETEKAVASAENRLDITLRNGLKSAIYDTASVIGAKVRTVKSGNVSSVTGAMDIQKAYVILERPISAVPRGFNKYAGYPSFKLKKLSTQKGFTSVSAIKLDGLKATSKEIVELDSLLKAGVIF